MTQTKWRKPERPLPSRYSPFDRDYKPRKSGFMSLSFTSKIIAGFGVVIIIALGTWLFRPKKNHFAEIPIIAAPDTPIKTRPDLSNIKSIPHQEKTIYNSLDNKAA